VGCAADSAAGGDHVKPSSSSTRSPLDFKLALQTQLVGDRTRDPDVLLVFAGIRALMRAVVMRSA
jgi:hypothetical protein